MERQEVTTRHTSLRDKTQKAGRALSNTIAPPLCTSNPLCYSHERLILAKCHCSYFTPNPRIFAVFYLGGADRSYGRVFGVHAYKPECLGEGSENRKFPTAVRRGLLDAGRKGLPRVSCTIWNPVLHRCNARLHRCKRLLALSVQKTLCTLS